MTGEAHACQPDADANTKIAFYKKVISKYADVIGAGEEKSVVELKEWLKACLKDASLQRVALTCNGWQQCVDFICSLPQLHPGIGVSFWLAPSEALEINAADGFDKAIFLQCLLKTKDVPAKIRVVELEGGFKHALVYFKAENDFVLVDPHACKVRLGKSLQDLLNEGFEGKKFIKTDYEFDQEEYQEF